MVEIKDIEDPGAPAPLPIPLVAAAPLEEEPWLFVFLLFCWLVECGHMQFKTPSLIHAVEGVIDLFLHAVTTPMTGCHWSMIFGMPVHLLIIEDPAMKACYGFYSLSLSLFFPSRHFFLLSSLRSAWDARCSSSVWMRLNVTT